MSNLQPFQGTMTMTKLKTLVVTGVATLVALTGCASNDGNNNAAAPGGNSAAAPGGNSAAAPDPGESTYGGDEHSAPQNAWDGTGKGTFTCVDFDAGVTYSFNVPTDTNDPRIQEVEKFRSNAGAPPVNYLLVEVDATTAGPPASSMGHTGYVPWGVSYATAEQTSGSASRMVNSSNDPSEWEGWEVSPPLSDDMPPLEETANPGAKGWGILHADEPITSMVFPAMSSGFAGTVNAQCEFEKK